MNRIIISVLMLLFFRTAFPQGNIVYLKGLSAEQNLKAINDISPDRRYDEFDAKYRYYIMGEDNIFHQVQLNRKSFPNMFPSKKKIIEKIFTAKQYENDKGMVLNILREF